MSREVIVRRLLIIGLATKAFYEEKRTQYIEEYEHASSKPATGYAPPHLVALATAGPTFVDLVMRTYNRDRIPLSDVSHFLELKLKHLPRLIDSLSSLVDAP